MYLRAGTAYLQNTENGLSVWLKVRDICNVSFGVAVEWQQLHCTFSLFSKDFFLAAPRYVRPF